MQPRWIYRSATTTQKYEYEDPWGRRQFVYAREVIDWAWVTETTETFTYIEHWSGSSFEGSVWMDEDGCKFGLKRTVEGSPLWYNRNQLWSDRLYLATLDGEPFLGFLDPGVDIPEQV